MASWMVHLRIADRLLDAMPGLSPVEFIVGNVAPDSGVPNADWSQFSPSTTVSHFKAGGEKACPERFAAKYFTPAQQKTYDSAQYSFYLGYLVHLITDVLWVRDIYDPSKIRFSEERARDPEGFIWKLKEDWYDLDYKYLRDHPGFRAFRVYLGAVGFVIPTWRNSPLTPLTTAVSTLPASIFRKTTIWIGNTLTCQKRKWTPLWKTASGRFPVC